MKNVELDALKKILAVFESHVSQQTQLLEEFRAILDGVSEAKKKQGYNRNPEYYKVAVRAWEKENPDKAMGYKKKHYEKKKAERLAKILELCKQGKSVKEISELLGISQKVVLNCLDQNVPITVPDESLEKGVDIEN